jgi:hypothetical protein
MELEIEYPNWVYPYIILIKGGNYRKGKANASGKIGT